MLMKLVVRGNNMGKVLIKNYFMFIVAAFLYALGFNLFYSPYNVVISGTTGLSLVFREWIGISPSTFVAIVSVFLLLVSFIYMGFDTTFKNIIGTLIYPTFLALTENLVAMLNINLSSMLLVVIYGGITIGVATGLMMRSGFTIGGFNILYQLFNKHFNISYGKSLLFINLSILLLGTYVFGLTNALYAVIALCISSYITDHVIIGVSRAKTFYIVTDKENEVKELVINKLSHTVTEISAKGGYTNKNKKLLMTVIPTKEYFILKEAVQTLDNDAFFLITDTYEVSSGKNIVMDGEI